MPSRKQFPTLSLTVPFSVESLDMFQLTDIINNHIKTVLEYVDQDKKVVFEIIDSEQLVTIKKNDQIITTRLINYEGENKKITEIEFDKGMDFIRWLYKIAPFIQVVGISNTNN